MHYHIVITISISRSCISSAVAKKYQRFGSYRLGDMGEMSRSTLCFLVIDCYQYFYVQLLHIVVWDSTFPVPPSGSPKGLGLPRITTLGIWVKCFDQRCVLLLSVIFIISSCVGISLLYYFHVIRFLPNPIYISYLVHVYVKRRS